MLRCRLCQLWAFRKNAVVGEGKFGGLMLVGEAPGREEDQAGRPFVGRAGRVLNAALEKASIDRSAVYITNVVKCRPPGNRRPLAEEVRSCMPYLFSEVEIVGPKALLLLGNTPAKALIGREGVFSLRGQQFYFRGIPAFVTIHPAAILRNPSLIDLLVEDLSLARRFI